MTRPPFAYFGGKQRIAARIAALLPPHRHYVEPFAGSLAVLLARDPAPFETVNDLDGALVTFWRVCRERSHELLRECELTPHGRAELDDTEPLAVPGDDLETARRVWVRISQSRGQSTARETVGWRQFLDPATRISMPDYLAAYTARIPAAAARLRHVSLENRPALDVVADYGQHPAVLLYCDPPYLGSQRGKEGHARYGAEMHTPADHEELADALNLCAAAVVVSGYPSPLYDRIYAGWSRAELPGSRGHGKARATTEVLWSNRPLTRPPTLWDDEHTTGPAIAGPNREERTG